MKVLFHNTISNYFSVDARFLKSFVPLMIKPGFLPKKFVEGKRLTYLHPAQTYLFISVIFFFLFSFEASEQQQAVDKLWDSETENNSEIVDFQNNPESVKKEIGPFISYSKTENKETSKDKAGSEEDIKVKKTDFEQNEIDSLIAAGASKTEILKSMGMSDNPSAFQEKFFEQMLKVHKRDGSGILQAFYNTFPISMFFLLPIFAFLLKLFYFKKGPFAHHMVFSFYFFSFIFVVFSLILASNFIWEIPDWIDSLAVFSTFFYLLIGVKCFYGEGYFVGFIKCGFVGFLFFMIIIPITVAIMALVSFMFY